MKEGKVTQGVSEVLMICPEYQSTCLMQVKVIHTYFDYSVIVKNNPSYNIVRIGPIEGYIYAIAR